MRNSFSFDLKVVKEVDILIKIGASFQILAPKYFIDLRPCKFLFPEGWKMSPPTA